MPRSPRRSVKEQQRGRAAAGRPATITGRAGAAAVLALAVLALSGCATTGGSAVGEAWRGVLGANSGLRSLRAEVEARVGYLNRTVTLPGVLVLQQPDLFRLDLLDPLDRPAAIIFPLEGRLVHYRPALSRAMALSPFTSDCRYVNPGAWVATVLADSLAPVAGEEAALRSFLGQRTLERSWKGELRQQVHYHEAGGKLFPDVVTWYCGSDPVMKLKVREWRGEGEWRIPQRMQVTYVQSGLEMKIQVKQVEGNPPPSADRLLPRLGSGTGWEDWNNLP